MYYILVNIHEIHTSIRYTSQYVGSYINSITPKNFSCLRHCILLANSFVCCTKPSSHHIYIYLFTSTAPKKTLTLSSTTGDTKSRSLLDHASASDMNRPPLGVHASASYPISIRRPDPRVHVWYEVIGAHASTFDYWDLVQKNYDPGSTHGHIFSMYK